jgi:hypothetical protein
MDTHVKEGVKNSINEVIDFYITKQKTAGLGIKHLRGTLWEARSGIKIRVLYDLSADQLTFILVGSHDDVKNFLKRI